MFHLRKKLAEFKRLLDIVLFKTYANLKREVDKTYLGCIWWILEPMISTAVYYLVFKYIIKAREDNFIIFIYIGTTIYGHFSTSINMGAAALLNNSALMQQVPLPKTLYPIIAICNLSWKYMLSMLVFLPLIWLNGMSINLAYIALPLLFLIQIFMVVSICLPLNILIPYFPDGKTIISAVLGVAVWLSGVFYTIDKVPAHFHTLFYLNPAAAMIEANRNILMYQQWPDFTHLIPSLTLCATLFALGVYLTKKLGGRVTKIPM